MTLQQVLNFLQARRSGTYFTIEMITTKKPSAQHKGVVLEKRTIVKNRIGQKYVSNDLNGTYESMYETIIPYRLKAKVDKNGVKQYYLEIHTAGSNPKVEYKVNGVVVDKETFNSYLTPSEANKKLDNSNAYYIVNINNILRLV